MSKHVLSVCIFCFICATHSPCASHVAVGHENSKLHVSTTSNDPPVITGGTKERIKPNADLGTGEELGINALERLSGLSSDHSNLINNKDSFIREIFLKYGDGETMSVEGFERLLTQVAHLRFLSTKSGTHRDEHRLLETKAAKNTSEMPVNLTCTVNDGLHVFLESSRNTTRNITRDVFEATCPALLLSIISEDCPEETHHNHDGLVIRQSNPHVWLYSIFAVIVISACGGLSLIIIPVMQKKFYKPLLQFLVALAVGTLAGDALLHLLPHAMSASSVHNHENPDHEESHENMWKGFVAMLGLILFFIMERFIPLLHKWRKGKRSKVHSHVKVLNTELEVNKGTETQCMDRYNPYPRCYKDILDDPTTTFMDADESAKKEEAYEKNKGFLIQQSARRKPDSSTVERFMNKNRNSSSDKQDEVIKLNSTEPSENHSHIVVDEIGDIFRDADYTVILREHGAVHHGHSHTHGHVHAAPQNLSSVAWMVIMGDGLHNFTDGMAIGAAFSSSMAGGFSTAVAVFCHELPHELGDFAMLLRAGMSIPKALFYNFFSSILCIVGNVVGIWLGNTDSASSWVFAVAAGTFIYIALVDMIPELSSAHEDEGNFVQSVLHLGGLMLGFGIMTLIALYEHDLKNIFKE